MNGIPVHTPPQQTIQLETVLRNVHISPAKPPVKRKRDTAPEPLDLDTLTLTLPPPHMDDSTNNPAPTFNWEGTTLPPSTGFPLVYGIYGSTMTKNLHPGTFNTWAHLIDEGRTLLVMLWEAGHSAYDATALLNIQTTIEDIGNCSGVVVAPPVAAVEGNSRYDYPWFALATNVPPKLQEALIQRRCISTEKVTFFAFPPGPPVLSYVGVVENLAYRASDVEAAARAVATVITSNERVKNFVQETHDNVDEGKPPLECLAESVTLTTCELGTRAGGTETVFKLFMRSPSQIANKHDEWLSLLSNVEIVLPLRPTARILPWKLHCRGCKSYEHPSGLCPFPLVNGWFARVSSKLNVPSTSNIQTSYAPTTASRGRGRTGKRGGRGSPYGSGYSRSRGRGAGRDR